MEGEVIKPCLSPRLSISNWPTAQLSMELPTEKFNQNTALN
jgi:hypothetical protein